VKTHVQSAYKKPQKQNAAITIKNINWIIIARKESTSRLSLNVTNAKLKGRSENKRYSSVLSCIPREYKACD